MNPTAIAAIALILVGTAIAIGGHEFTAGVCMFAGGFLAMIAGLLGLVQRRGNDRMITRAVLLILVGFWVAFTGFALVLS